MTWQRKTTADNKYRTAEHRAQLAAYKAELARVGYVVCVAEPCLFDSRLITNPRGLEPDGITAGHTPDGTSYQGPEHRACNIRDGAVRASRRSHGTDHPQGWDI